MNKTAEWQEIMAQLRGTKLHVYDDITQGVPPVESALRIQEALGWLVYHRYIHKDGDRYVARTFSEARELWAKEGTARLEAAAVGRQRTEDGEQPAPGAGEPAAASVQPVAEPVHRAVHKHQTELFP